MAKVKKKTMWRIIRGITSGAASLFGGAFYWSAHFFRSNSPTHNGKSRHRSFIKNVPSHIYSLGACLVGLLFGLVAGIHDTISMAKNGYKYNRIITIADWQAMNRLEYRWISATQTKRDPRCLFGIIGYKRKNIKLEAKELLYLLKNNYFFAHLADGLFNLHIKKISSQEQLKEIVVLLQESGHANYIKGLALGASNKSAICLPDTFNSKDNHQGFVNLDVLQLTENFVDLKGKPLTMEDIPPSLTSFETTPTKNGVRQCRDLIVQCGDKIWRPNDFFKNNQKMTFKAALSSQKHYRTTKEVINNLIDSDSDDIKSLTTTINDNGKKINELNPNITDLMAKFSGIESPYEMQKRGGDSTSPPKLNGSSGFSPKAGQP